MLRVGVFVPSYSTFFNTTRPFVCVFMCTKHKTPNKSHSWLAPLGSFCSAHVRVRLLTCRLALHARDTGRGGGGGAGARASLGLLRSACFAWLALLGLHCSARFARLALLGLRCSAYFARLALLGSRRSARFDWLALGCDCHCWFPCLGQASPKNREEHGALASGGCR